MNRLVVLLLVSASVTSGAILPCVSKGGPLPKAVVIEDCDGIEERCEFVRGKSFKADVTFKACNILFKFLIIKISELFEFSSQYPI